MGKAIEAPLTVEQVAALLQISPQTVSRYLAAGTIRAYKVASKWRVDPDAVEEYLEDCRAAQQAKTPVVYKPKSVAYQTTTNNNRLPQTTRQLPPALSKTGDSRRGLSRG